MLMWLKVGLNNNMEFRTKQNNSTALMNGKFVTLTDNLQYYTATDDSIGRKAGPWFSISL